jgi:hypothetical protein
MVFRTLALSALLISSFSFAQGRKPAVEDFVGIEVEEAAENATPTASEALYNLEQDLNKIEAEKHKPEQKIVSAPAPVSTGWSMTAVIGISLLLGLPMLVWLMMMSHLKKKASLESASNIEVLEKYRKEREKKSEESVRKVS